MGCVNKMKYLIYQYYRKLPNNEKNKFIIDDVNDYFMLSEKSISAYANKFDNEYKFFNYPMGDHPPFYGIFLPFTEQWCHDYDAVCFIDSDILATIHSKNIFDNAADDRISSMWMRTHAVWRRNKNTEYWADKGHTNSGVVVFPRAVYEPMIEFCKTLRDREKVETRVFNMLGNFDQAQINLFVKQQNKFHKLSEEFNYHLGREPHGKRFDQSLIHYHRKHKSMMHKDFDDGRILK